MDRPMKKIIFRLLNVILGLFLYSLGIAVTLKANIGYAPWDVLHVGLSNITGLSIGTISIIVGALIVLIVTVSGEKIGLSTVLNMILIGSFLDLILWSGLLPKAENVVYGIVMLIIGLFIIALGTYFYIKSAYGVGPRDNLMVVFRRKTGWPIGFCRGIVELAVTLIGWFLGGMAGIGTLISVVAIGFCVQIVFRLFKFDAVKVKHETLGYTFRRFTENPPNEPGS